MVAPHSRKTGRPGLLREERCAPMGEVIDNLTKATPQADIGVGLSAIDVVADMSKDGLTTDYLALRIASQSISIATSGCIAGRESTRRVDRLVVLDCPNDTALRCADCILNISNGQDILDKLKPNII